jgi:hypothetical protein
MEQDRNRHGPEVRVDREQQTRVPTPVAQSLHDGNEWQNAQPQAAVLLRNRHALDAELRALLPVLPIEAFEAVAFGDVMAERLPRERDRGVLPLLLVGTEVPCPRGHEPSMISQTAKGRPRGYTERVS